MSSALYMLKYVYLRTLLRLGIPRICTYTTHTMTYNQKYNQERFDNWIDAKDGVLEITWKQRVDILAFGETPHNQETLHQT